MLYAPLRVRACGPLPARVSRLLLLAALLAALCLPAGTARAATLLWLPTPPGEAWKIIQGYACGTHNSWDRYSLDLANAKGATYGAPVRAAADGTVWAWTPGSGTIILSHGGGFYTMYTHMSSVIATARGTSFKRGAVIGAVGDRGSPGIPHLHFTAFTGRGAAASGRQSVPLVFAEGYNLAEVGGCNQHGGKTLVANPDAEAAKPGVNFQTSLEREHWYSGDDRIRFSGLGLVRGYSVAWNSAPADGKPEHTEAHGEVRLAAAGEGLHTLHVRAWGLDGEQTLVTFGPVGFDRTPPEVAALAHTVALTVSTEVSPTLSWDAAYDRASGVAGYRVYLGPDTQGISKWFVPGPSVQVPALAAGSHTLRVQAIDYADNASDWVTLGQVLSAPPEDDEDDD